MQTTSQNRGGNYLVSISGAITIDSSPDLRIRLLQSFKAPNCKSLTLDFCEVVFVDTSALAVLLEVLKTARVLGKAFHLTGVREGPHYLLATTRLLHLFDESAGDAPQL